MRITTISVKSSTKRVMEKAKKVYEMRVKKRVSWDEFLLSLLSSHKTVIKDIDILELNESEAELLKNLLRKGRESWRERV
ncbi:MAG: hypothetical protein DRJ45_09390 [Thermoprotei archaeon]|nr:MAG: hypothetical protein DRJ45_09390 [Thermoprotei archaeon]